MTEQEVQRLKPGLYMFILDESCGTRQILAWVSHYMNSRKVFFFLDACSYLFERAHSEWQGIVEARFLFATPDEVEQERVRLSWLEAKVATLERIFGDLIVDDEALHQAYLAGRSDSIREFVDMADKIRTASEQEEVGG